MPTQAHILIVEDDYNTALGIQDLLKHAHYKVSTAYTGADGLKQAQRKNIHLILLDIMLPDTNGLDVCRNLREQTQTKHIPIIMLTNNVGIQDHKDGLELGADDYLTKPYDGDILLAHIKALLRRSMPQPFPSLQPSLILSLTCILGQKITIHLAGLSTSRHQSTNRFSLNRSLEQAIDHASSDHWRSTARHIGKQFYNVIFNRHPAVSNSYHQAIGLVPYNNLLHIRLESPGDMLNIPFECVLNSNSDQADYIVLQHPFARTLLSEQVVKTTSLSPSFFNELYANKTPLRGLFIASNTPPALSHVNQEIRQISQILQKQFEPQGIETQFDLLNSKQTTYDRVKQKIATGNYHLIHFAGHAIHDPNVPERSFLSLWEKSNQRGELKRLYATELQQLLQNSNTRFVYLSCCRSSASGSTNASINSDVLGLADSILRAGVPTVLGFHWPISDTGARKLAQIFYKGLAQTGLPDLALLQARREVAAQNRDDITWLSPMLIMQA